jgi:uroporphyrin-3 C-methyltransferase
MTDKPKSPDSSKAKSQSDDTKTSSGDNNQKLDSVSVENTHLITDKSMTEPDTRNTQTKSSKPSSKAKNESQSKPAKTGLLWLVTLINFIIIILVIAAAYWYYTQISENEANEASLVSQFEQQYKQQLQNLNQRSEGNSAAISSTQQKLNESLESQADSVDNMLAQVLQNANTNTAIQKRLAEMSGRRPSDWLLAEANYLVNMAGRKVYLDTDIRTAITLLQEADARLEDLNDPALFPVRALIAADIQTLSAINPTSTTSIALAISGMLQKVSGLPLDVLQLPEPEAEKDLSLSEDVSDWRENLARTWQTIIGDLVTTTELDTPLEPYLAERQQWLIEQQLKHALAQSQSAVLDEQEALYVASIQTAIGLLIEHYKLDDPSVSQFVNALQELQNADFSRKLPNKLESQSSLKDILQNRVQNLYNNMPAANDNFSTNEGLQL